MKRNQKQNGSKRVFVIFLVCLFLLSGCGKEKQDNLEEELIHVDTDVNSDSDAEKASADVQEQLTYILSTSGCTINVDAAVTSTGYQNMDVYEQNPVTVDDAYIKNLAEHIFDDGEYTLVKPYEICSMEELQEEEQYLQELYMEADYKYSSYVVGALDIVGSYIDTYDEKNVQELPEGTLIFRFDENVDGGYAGRETCTLRGLVDGNMADLRYRSWEGGRSLYIHRYTADTVYKYCSTEYELAATLYGENLCNLEEASRTAQDIIDNMGYTDMKQTAAQHRVISNGEVSETSMYTNGYSFIFVRETDGIENILGEESYAVINDSYGEDISNLSGAGQEYISVDVDSEGVIGIYFGNMYERGERLSDQTSTLSFEQVDEIAQGYMNDILEGWTDGTFEYEFNVVAVRLGYVTLLYDKQYTLVPVWVYVQENAFSDQTLDSIFFGVNALDGSIVQFTFDGVYGNPAVPYYYFMF